MLLQARVLPQEEEVWQVVDKYTLALRQTEEQDLLNECRAHARLGGVFDKHLKMRNKAVLNCKRAVQLAHHIKPHPTGHDWYMVSQPACLSECLLPFFQLSVQLCMLTCACEAVCLLVGLSACACLPACLPAC